MSNLYEAVIQLDKVNKELQAIENGERDQEFKAKAKALFSDERRKAMENELQAKLNAIFCNI